MASLRVLAFDNEGRPAQFDTWLDDLQLYLLSDSKESVSLFDLASGAATAPPATAYSSTRSQWLTRDAAARLAIRNHLPLAECAHFGQHRPCTTLDHFLSLDPTSLTVDLLEKHLLAAETSAVAVGAAHGTQCQPFFEGCFSSPLAPSYASAAAADVSVPEDVGATSASAKRRSSKGKGGRGGGGGSGGGGGGSGSDGGGSSGGGGGGETVGGSGGSGGAGGGSGGSGGNGGGGTGTWRVGSGGGQRQQQQRRSKTPSPQQLREWFLRGASGGSCPYVIRTGDRAGQTCGRSHTQHQYFSCLDDTWRAEFGDDVELPRWADLRKSRIAIFDLDFDAILSAMYALSVSAEGDCYQCVPPDQGIAAAALNPSESGTLPGTAPAEALHTFTLDSGASRCFFQDSTTLTPLPATVPVRLADPFGGPVVACSSTVLPCPADAMVTTTTPGGQRVSICTCTRTGRHLATFTRRPGSSAASRGAPSGGAAYGGPEPGGAGSEGPGSGGAEPGGAEPEGLEPGGAASEGAESVDAEPQGAASSGGSVGASTRLSPQQLREWFVRRTRLWSGTARGGGTGVAAGAGVTGDLPESGTSDAGGAGAGGAGVGGHGAGGARVGGPGVGGAGPGGAGAVDPGGAPASPLPAPSPYTEQFGGLRERREPASRPVSPVCTTRPVPRLRLPPVPGTHAMTLHPSSVPLCIPLPAPPESSLPEVPDPESDRAHAASPNVSHLLATVVTVPSFEYAAASALVAELLDFAAACHLDYATTLVAESASVSPPSVGGECALGTDVLEDRQEEFECLAAAVPRFASMLLAPEGDPDAPDIPTLRSYAEAITGPYSSQWHAAMDAEMASWKSTGTYVDEVPPPRANIVDGMWIFRVKRPPGSPPAFKARYVATGFNQR
ncbi:unnamed protein product [Closterium sp. NIES-54]